MLAWKEIPLHRKNQVQLHVEECELDTNSGTATEFNEISESTNNPNGSGKSTMGSSAADHPGTSPEKPTSTSTSTILLRKACTASREGSVYQG